VGQVHQILITVEDNPGTGFVTAPAGTIVHLTLNNDGTSTAVFTDSAGVPNGNGTGEDITLLDGGTANAWIDSNTAGTISIHGSTTLTVGGVSLVRATGDGLGETSHFDGADAQKIYRGFFEIKGFKYNDVLGNDNAGGTVGSGDDIPLNGVAIQLWQESNNTPGLQTTPTADTLVSTQLTGSGSNVTGGFDFTNLDPSKTYYLVEVVPIGSTQTAGGTVANPVVIQGTNDGISNGTANNFANFSPPPTGSTATIGFWQNKNGNAVILSGGADLVSWLKTNFPNLYGGATGSSTVPSLTDAASVEALFTSGQNSYFGSKGTKTNAQVLNIALAIYFSDVNNNSTAQKFGFTGGTGGILVNVGQNGASFGLPNGTIAPLLTLLHDVDAHTVNGVIWGGSGPLWLGVNNVFDFVANAFDI
jgi:hypothetical protein